jgi:hypothetical protein
MQLARTLTTCNLRMFDFFPLLSSMYAWRGRFDIRDLVFMVANIPLFLVLW